MDLRDGSVANDEAASYLCLSLPMVANNPFAEELDSDVCDLFGLEQAEMESAEFRSDLVEEVVEDADESKETTQRGADT